MLFRSITLVGSLYQCAVVLPARRERLKMFERDVDARLDKIEKRAEEQARLIEDIGRQIKDLESMTLNKYPTM